MYKNSLITEIAKIRNKIQEIQDSITDRKIANPRHNKIQKSLSNLSNDALLVMQEIITSTSSIEEYLLVTEAAWKETQTPIFKNLMEYATHDKEKLALLIYDSKESGLDPEKSILKIQKFIYQLRGFS